MNFYKLICALEQHVWDLVVLTVTCLYFLTDHIDERAICNAVSPTKDVDGFHVVNVGRMCLDQSTMLPATPWGVWEIIKRTGKRSDHVLPVKIKTLLNKQTKAKLPEFSPSRYSYYREECRGCGALQECGHAHRHVTAYRWPPWEARRLVIAHMCLSVFLQITGLNIWYKY